MQAQHLVWRVALDALCAGIPCQDVALAIQQIDGIFADALDDGAEAEVLGAQLLLRGALLGDVADEAEHCGTGTGFHRLEHDVDGKLGAVLAQAEEIERRAHLPSARVSRVVLAMAGMAARKRWGTSISTGWPISSSLA